MPLTIKMYDENGSESGPKGSFEIYKSEGDVLFKQQMFTKAIECYNMVILSYSIVVVIVIIELYVINIMINAGSYLFSVSLFSRTLLGYYAEAI